MYQHERFPGTARQNRYGPALNMDPREDVPLDECTSSRRAYAILQVGKPGVQLLAPPESGHALTEGQKMLADPRNECDWIVANFGTKEDASETREGLPGMLVSLRRNIWRDNGAIVGGRRDVLMTQEGQALIGMDDVSMIRQWNHRCCSKALGT